MYKKITFLIALVHLLIGTISFGQVVTTFAGTGAAGSTDGTGTAASFFQPSGVAFDATGNMYVADAQNNKIRKITPLGVVTTFAGSGASGATDGTGTAASFNIPADVAVDASNNVYVADSGNNKIRKITPLGVVTTFAGSGTTSATDGTGTAASFTYPQGLAFDTSGILYVADLGNNKVRKITSAGVVTTLAGSGGTAVIVNFPYAVAIDALGNVYVSEYVGQKVTKITFAGVVTTLAGSGTAGAADGTGTAASFNYPKGLAVDASGNVYVADAGNHDIRKITSAGVVTTFAGSSTSAGSTDGTGTAASFNQPSGIVIDASGKMFVTDVASHKIRKIVIVVPPSDVVLTQIGNEGDSPNTVPSVVTTTQLGQILPTITGIVTANESAYQEYIDANPNAFSAPATAIEVQAMVTAVNAAITASNSVLTQIGNEGDSPNTVPSVTTTTQLGQILPAITGIVAVNQAAYQAYIDANPNAFSAPATAIEVQAMMTVVNAAITASNSVLTQIGNEGDSPNTVPSVVTTNQLGQIVPAITGIIPANQSAYQSYIDANPDSFSAPATTAEVQAMVNAVNAVITASNAVLAQIGNEGDSPNTVSSVVTTTQLGQIVPAITGIIPIHQTAYQTYIDTNPNLFSSPATATEVQAMINAVNLTQSTIYYVDASRPDNSGDGLSWSTAKRDLQEILDNHGNNPGPNINEVWVKAGNYIPTSFVGTSTATRDKAFWVKGNIKIYGGFNGEETTLNQRDIVNNQTILDGSGAYHTMLVTNTSATSTLTLIDGFTIKGGNANGSAANPVGGINYERNFGGGVLCYQNAPTFNNVIFKTNAAEYGGGVFNQGGSPKYNNCVFTENTSTSYGGGIENFENSTPVFNNCIVSNNSAFRGGAAANNGGTATYINCTIVKNIATVATAGGAFHNLNATVSTYKNCVIWGNTASDFLTEAGSTINVSYSVTQSTIAGTLNLSTDPQLVNSNDGNGADDKWFTNDDGFKISLISNCGSTGDNSAIPSYITGDILNNSRILQVTVDRGAYEVDGANASNSALEQIGNEGDAPNAVLSAITITQLGQIVPIITGIVTANEAAYQAYIDANPSLFSSPATAAEVQAMVTAVNAALSINDFDAIKISIYPNPSNSIFNIEIDVNATIELYDVTGKRLRFEKIIMGTTALNLSNYSDGVYSLKITNENNQTKTVRLVKK